MYQYNNPYFSMPYMCYPWPCYPPIVQNFGFVRFLHASPDAPAVDIYVDCVLVASNVSFGQSSDYLPLMPGVKAVNIFAAGTTTNPVISAPIIIKPCEYMTVAAIDRLSRIRPLAILDDSIPAMGRKAKVRFVHLSPDAPPVNITLVDGTVLFRNIRFTEISNYITVDAGTYNLQVRVAATNALVLNVPRVTVAPGGIYTIYAIGLAVGMPRLQALILEDGK